MQVEFVPRYTRRGITIIDKKYRSWTSSLRHDPAFVVIGAKKCGTSSLFRNLQFHPNVVLPKEKEMHFFEMNHRKGLDWYRAKFPLRLQPKALTAKGNPRLVSGEATVDYLYMQKFLRCRHCV